MSLNDPQWGRGGGSKNSNDGGREDERRPQRPGNDGPPDLDELWRDFNRRLNNLFGRRGGGGRPSGGGLGGLRPNGKGAGVGLGAVIAVIALIWLGSGFYIVPEGQVGVVTTFGKYSETTRPGWKSWRHGSGCHR